jgi:hypothetical protein
MSFQQQGSAEFIYWLTFAVVVGLGIAGIWAVFKLGGLPGRVAAARGHPQAAAISVCGWLGLLTFVLWPIALVWAYAVPVGGVRLAASDDLDGLLVDLRRTSDRVAAIEAGLGTTSPKKVA